MKQKSKSFFQFIPTSLSFIRKHLFHFDKIKGDTNRIGTTTKHRKIIKEILILKEKKMQIKKRQKQQFKSIKVRFYLQRYKQFVIVVVQ